VGWKTISLAGSRKVVLRISIWPILSIYLI
jgi:hypothetical protein